MGMTLLDHWRDALQACGDAWLDSGRARLRWKIYRFLLGSYAEAALTIEFPPRFPDPPEPMLVADVQPRPPKSPERIRMLLAQVAEAVAAGSQAQASW